MSEGPSTANTLLNLRLYVFAGEAGSLKQAATKHREKRVMAVLRRKRKSMDLNWSAFCDQGDFQILKLLS